MPRSVNAVASRARRKRILKAAKGFYGKRKNVYTVAASNNIIEIRPTIYNPTFLLIPKN